MNEHIFYELIHPWILKKDIPITLNRHSSEKQGIKKQANSTKIEDLYLDIYIHTGSPCYRYCICPFFTKEDKKLATVDQWYN
jgi:hypothetical protein